MEFCIGADKCLHFVLFTESLKKTVYLLDSIPTLDK